MARLSIKSTIDNIPVSLIVEYYSDLVAIKDKLLENQYVVVLHDNNHNNAPTIYKGTKDHELEFVAEYATSDSVAQAYGVATNNNLGLVKIGENITVTNGAISITADDALTALGGGGSDNTSYKFLKMDGSWATPENTTYSVATPEAAGLMSAEDKAKLNGMAENANSFELEKATADELGGVKVGSNITIAEDGTLSVTQSNILTALEYDSADTTKFLRSDGTWVTPTDTNTTYNAATNSELGIVQIGDNISVTENGIISVSKDNALTALEYDNTGTETTQYLRKDGTWATPTDTNTTYTAATNAELGLVQIGDNISVTNGGVISVSKDNALTALEYDSTGEETGQFLRKDGSWATPPNTDTTYEPATTDKLGLVKVGSNITVDEHGTISVTADDALTALGGSTKGNTTTFLRNDGSWGIPVNTDTTYDVATPYVDTENVGSDGLLSAADKAKLDSMEAGAHKYTLPNATTSTLGGVIVGNNISVDSGTISVSSDNVLTALEADGESTEKFLNEAGNWEALPKLATVDNLISNNSSTSVTPQLVNSFLSMDFDYTTLNVNNDPTLITFADGTIVEITYRADGQVDYFTTMGYKVTYKYNEHDVFVGKTTTKL